MCPLAGTSQESATLTIWSLGQGITTMESSDRAKSASEHPPAPAATTARAWAAWGVWRGDRALLAHTARRAIAEVRTFSSDAVLTIDVDVRDDVEQYTAPEQLAECLTAQAARSFRAIRIEASSSTVGVRITLARQPLRTGPYAGAKGVVIEVWSSALDADARDATLGRIGEAMRVTVRRGSMPWTRGLTALNMGSNDEISPALKRLMWRRRRNTMALVVLLSVGLLFLPLLVGRVLGAAAATLHDLRTVAFWATPLVIVIGLLTSGLIMPAIELADRTPGRRWVSLFARSGVLTVGVGVVTAAVKGKLHLS